MRISDWSSDVCSSDLRLEQAVTVTPPASRVACNALGNRDRRPPRPQLPEHDGATLPLLELDGPQPVAYPFIQPSPERFGLRQPEVALPSQHIDTQTT